VDAPDRRSADGSDPARAALVAGAPAGVLGSSGDEAPQPGNGVSPSVQGGEIVVDVQRSFGNCTK